MRADALRVGGKGERGREDGQHGFRAAPAPLLPVPGQGGGTRPPLPHPSLVLQLQRQLGNRRVAAWLGEAGIQRMLPRNKMLDKVKQQGGSGASPEAIAQSRAKKYAIQTFTRHLFSKGYDKPGVAGEMALGLYDEMITELGAPSLAQINSNQFIATATQWIQGKYP